MGARQYNFGRNNLQTGRHKFDEGLTRVHLECTNAVNTFVRFCVSFLFVQNTQEATAMHRSR